MKRLAWLSGVFFLCAFFVGCASDAYSGKISDTILKIEGAASEIDLIRAKVDDAVKRADAGEAFDLKEAIEQTKKLQDTAKATQKLKGEIEAVKAKITDEDRQKNADEFRSKLNDAFTTLLKRRDELRKSLEAAEKHGKGTVKELRDKITEAEGPFESLAR